MQAEAISFACEYVPRYGANVPILALVGHCARLRSANITGGKPVQEFQPHGISRVPEAGRCHTGFVPPD
jgi:hypothetical protein